MTYDVLMADCMELMRRLAREARVKHGVGDNEIIVPYIEQDHGIKVVYDPNAMTTLVKEPSKSYIKFANEAQYTFLLLKYSN
jgi:hypothetical protein